MNILKGKAMTHPSFSVHQNIDGSTTSTVTSNLGTINWAALLQAIVAALPALMAIISAFSSTPIPTAPPAAAEKD
jgi:hypothetical protein